MSWKQRENFMKKLIKAKAKKMTLALPASKYEKDFFKWTLAQAQLLKEGKLDRLDLENLAEEIESLGKSDKRSLRSHLQILLLHLLKLKYQPEEESKSWHRSIKNTRDQIYYILQDSPSLKRLIPELIREAYESARENTAFETRIDLKKFPKNCPWDYKEIMKN